MDFFLTAAYVYTHWFKKEEEEEKRDFSFLSKSDWQQSIIFIPDSCTIVKEIQTERNNCLGKDGCWSFGKNINRWCIQKHRVQ